MPDDTLSIDYVCGSEGNSCIFSCLDQTAIVSSNSFVDVREQWNLHFANTTVFPRFKSVLHVGELGID